MGVLCIILIGLNLNTDLLTSEEEVIIEREVVETNSLEEYARIRAELEAKRAGLVEERDALDAQIEEIEEALDWREEPTVAKTARVVVPQNEIERLIVAYWPEQPEMAIAVAKAESGLVPTASNWNDAHRGCNGSFGIFQIGCIHGSEIEDLYNVEYNIKKARQIYDAAGSWQPWGAVTDGSYKRHLATL